MINPGVVVEVEQMLREGTAMNAISARLAVPVNDVRAIRDRMAAIAAPKDLRFEALIEGGLSSPYQATRRKAQRARDLVDALRHRLTWEARAAQLRSDADRVALDLADAMRALRESR